MKQIFALSAAAALCLTACDNSGNPAPVGSVAGTYKGTYTCNQGLTGLTLTLNKTDSNLVTGVFDFYAVASNPSVPSGSYTVKGTLNGSALKLDGEKWIKQPATYEIVVLDGNFNNDFTRYSGKVIGSNCTTFNLEKQ